MRWLTNFSFKWTATAAIEIHPTKARLPQLVNFKMQSERGDTLEERYAITFCFKLEKKPQKTFRMIQTVPIRKSSGNLYNERCIREHERILIKLHR